MTGFTADWLRLRESVDARAQAALTTERAAAWARVHGSEPLRVLDLGAGSGNNFRFLAPRLPRRQVWRLIDDDPALIAEAKRRGLPAGAERAVEIETAAVDLAHADLTHMGDGFSLITASALFDLVSEEWCQALVAATASPGRALLAALTYDGRMGWQPEDPDDRFVTALVNAHQRRDKGFGPALGPAAVPALTRHLAASGAKLTLAASDWDVGPADAAMHAQLLTILAAAAAEQAPNAGARVDEWLARRLALIPACRLCVGHLNIFAVW
jgi:SAM-dependent methyltransferase